MTSEDASEKRKPGRPKKSADRLLSEYLRVRVTSAQARAFRERAQRRGLTPAALLRKFVTGRVEALDDLVIALESIAMLRRSCGELSVVEDRIRRLAQAQESRDLEAVADAIARELEPIKALVKELEPKGVTR